ncbi:MAG: hypothetical protein GHHEDOFH_01685 [Pseudorhodoplanes sp.]|nr:hypothetical protein [Pseudorhodoplanes sp.]
MRDLLGALAHARDIAQHPDGGDRVVEAAVDQNIGNAGLFLHAVGERDIGIGDGTEIDDQVRLRRKDDFEVRRSAAPRDTADLRQPGRRGREERGFRRARLAIPADELFGRKHIDQHGRRRTGRHDPLDPVGNFDPAARGIDDDARRRGFERRHREQHARAVSGWRPPAGCDRVRAVTMHCHAGLPFGHSPKISTIMGRTGMI